MTKDHLRLRVLFVASVFPLRSLRMRLPVIRTVDTNIAPLFQPLNQHLQAILSKPLARLSRLRISVTEILRGMILLDSAAASCPGKRKETLCEDALLRLLLCARPSELAHIKHLDSFINLENGS